MRFFHFYVLKRFWLLFGMILIAFLVLVQSSDSREQEDFDVIIRNGTIYDGTGAPGRVSDVLIRNDKIVSIGSAGKSKAKLELDAGGLAVSPGFINMLSWAGDTLIVDGHSQSDIRQGVTLEIFGEGLSMGPLNEAMKTEMVEQQGDVKFEVKWTKLSEYLNYVTAKGISPNVASFVGATTVRVHVLGYADRAPSATELEHMKSLVREAMKEGALGVGSSLIYAPASFSSTNELIELARVAGEYGGMYISHIRGEGASLLDAVDELIRIAREANVRAEIYHLKAAGSLNWHKMDAVIEKVEAARKQGLKITADMYLYTASSTGLDAAMPTWVQEGGLKAWIERLKDPAVRERLKKEMPDEWRKAGRSADKTLLIAFKNEKLKPLTGKTLAEVAKLRKQSPLEAAMDLVVEDGSRVGVVYFSMSEENLKKQIKLPWVSFGSDAESLKPEGVFVKSNIHPRAYGNFARLLAKYVREERLIPLEEAIRKLTSLPASNLRLDRRGLLKPGYYADVVVFDPKTIQDHATFEKPHQFSTGVKHVFVNGVAVLKDGSHTGATPGKVLRPLPL